jgi:hypothetical protein
MKLNEIKKIETIKTEALSTIKGGGRDSRGDQPVSSSPYTEIITVPKNSKP